MRERVAVVGLLVAVLASGCASRAPATVLERSVRFDTPIDLPEPDRNGEMTLEEALAERRSRRTFGDDALSLSALGQLFWAGQGITDSAGHRTAPSAGALYPLELYAVTATSLLHYLPDGHRVERRSDDTALASMHEAAFGQDFVSSAPAVLVVAGVVARTEAEYGARAGIFVEREAGHATQNVLLQATAFGLAATPVGGFDPDVVAELLALPPGEEPLYLIPVGEARR